MGCSIQALATAKATRPMIASGREGRYRKAASKMTLRKSAVSRPSRSFDSPARSWYGMSTSTIFAVANPADERHLAGLIQPRAQHHIGLLAHESPAKVGKEVRIAGAIGVEEPEQIRVGLPPGLLDGGAISSVLLEHDELDGVGVAAGALDGAVRRAVAHHGDVHGGHGRALDDLRAGLQRSPDDALDALFLVQRGNDDQELHGRLRDGSGRRW